MSSATKILIIDDDPSLRKTLGEILSIHHYQVEEASSGAQAVKAAKDGDFSIALIDLKLMDLSGLEVLKKLKEISPNTECLITTGHASTDTAIEAVNLGAYSYLQKPYDIDQLLVTIRRASEKSQARFELAEAETRYQQLYEGAIDGILSTDLNGRILDYNSVMIKMLGYSKEELLSLTYMDLTPEKYRQLEEGMVGQILHRGYSDLYEKELRKKGGALLPVEISGYLSKDSQGNLTGMWGFIRDITERKISEKKIQRQLMEVSVLRDVAEAGISSSSIDQLIEKVTEVMANSFYSDYFGVNLYDPKRRWMFPHYSYRGIDYDLTKKGFSIDQGITGRAFRTGKPQNVSNVTLDADYLNWRTATLSEIAVPIRTEAGIIGVINAESTEPNHYSLEDLGLLSAIANQLGVAIHKFQLIEDQRKRNDELTALYETSLAAANITDPQTLYERLYQQIHSIFHPDAFLLAFFNQIDESVTIAYAIEEENQITEFQNKRFEKEDSGLMGWIMRHKQTLRFADMTIEPLPVESPQEGKPIRSWLGVPLIKKGVVIGSISVQCFEADVYTAEHQRLLESMAAQLAVAIDNSQLVEQINNQLERLASLHDIDTAINSSLDLRVIMNILLDQVIKQLGVDAAAVLLMDYGKQELRFKASRGFKTHDIEKYAIPIEKEFLNPNTLEQHLIQALDLGESHHQSGYADIFQNEGFESFFSVPLVSKGQIKGVLDVFHRKLLNPDQDWFNFLDTLAGQAAIAIDNTTLLDELNSTNIDLTQAYDTTLEGWSRALEMRDHETEGHTRRVAEMTVKIARELGIPEEGLVHIRRGALLHDIGKMGIPDRILLKPGPLNDEEWVIMRSHARRAFDLLNPIEYLRPALEVPLHHHERFDGSGYPDGLKGEAIPLPARIFAVVDIWDALTSDRPYRKAWSVKKSLEYINQQAGKQLDPQVVEVFMMLIHDELFDGKEGKLHS